MSDPVEQLDRVTTELIMLNATHLILERLSSSGIQPKHVEKYRWFLTITVQNYFSASITTVYKLYYDKKREVASMRGLASNANPEQRLKLDEIQTQLDVSKEMVVRLRHNYFAHLNHKVNELENMSMQVSELGTIVDLLNRYMNVLYDIHGKEPLSSYLPTEYREESVDIDELIYFIKYNEAFPR